METDTEIGALIRRVVEQGCGVGAAPGKVVLREMIAACDEELRRLGPSGGVGVAAAAPATVSPIRKLRSRMVADVQSSGRSPLRPMSPASEGPATGGTTTPPTLHVQSPEKPSVEGVYHLLPELHNGNPAWGFNTCRLYTTRAGYWMLTASERGPDRDVGVVESTQPHRGVLPHLVTAWQAYDRGVWVPSAALITSQPIPEEEGHGQSGGYSPLPQHQQQRAYHIY